MKKYIIAGGNPTLLVWDCSPAKKPKIVKKYLGDVEQVGFVDESNGIPRLTMMGNEMCINATLALAYELRNNNKLFSSGFEGKIGYANSNETTQIQFGLTFKRIGGIILLPGIGFLFSANRNRLSKGFLLLLAKMFKRPAFGIVVVKKNKITPFIYVQETDSLIRETACGSASIALTILNDFSDIVQPTGQIISVAKRRNIFSISTKVKEVKPYDQR